MVDIARIEARHWGALALGLTAVVASQIVNMDKAPASIEARRLNYPHGVSSSMSNIFVMYSVYRAYRLLELKKGP